MRGERLWGSKVFTESHRASSGKSPRYAAYDEYALLVNNQNFLNELVKHFFLEIQKKLFLFTSVISMKETQRRGGFDEDMMHSVEYVRM